MIKNIKRVGIIFLAVAIICLLVIGCLIAVNVQNNIIDNGLNVTQKDDLDNNISVSSVAPPTATKNFTLTCDCADGMPCTCGKMAEIWDNAIQTSIDMYGYNRKWVNVYLDKDWIAKEDSNWTRSFGTGIAFLNGRIAIPRGAEIRLDLCGNTIDRGFTSRDADGNLTADKGRSQGNVIIVYGGTFALYDSTYDDAVVKDIYREYGDNKEQFYNQLKALDYGKITGGSSTKDSNGGGISIQMNAYFDMYGGIITGNWAKDCGAIWCEAPVKIWKGLIFDNASHNYAAISTPNNASIKIEGGMTVFNKTTKNAGGGIYMGAVGFSLIIRHHVVAYNYAEASAGGIVCRYGQSTDLGNIDVVYNTSGTSVGGIQVYQDTRFFWGGGYCNIYGNTNVDGERSDLCLYGDRKINFTGPITTNPIIDEDGNEQPGEEYAKMPMVINGYTGAYRLNAFTSLYKQFNADLNPALIFESDKYNGRPTVKNGEVYFDFSADSDYDYLYMEDGIRKNYKDNDKLYGFNDNNVTSLILGNVLPNTSVNEFITNIQPFGYADIKLFNGVGTQVYGNGCDSTYESLFDNANELAIGTGWRIDCIIAEKSESIYISVLGDITGDGKVNSADVNYLRQAINDNSLYNNLADKQYIQLAMLILNKNGLTKNDAEILWNVVCGKMDIKDFI